MTSNTIKRKIKIPMLPNLNKKKEKKSQHKRRRKLLFVRVIHKLIFKN
jgi:hypothetical protein